MTKQSLPPRARSRWLEWIVIVVWTLIGSAIFMYLPKFREIFASFGNELPMVTRAWLWLAPMFAFAPGAAALMAVLLLTKFKNHEPGPRWRKLLWGALIAAVVVCCWTFCAMVAPMFCGGLVDGSKR